MILKKVSSVALSAVMATIMMVPFSAFATQQPSVEYTGGNGDPITHLYLIADDSNLANNRDADWNKTNAKVEVPVAIHYVAQANGNIVGPADEAAQIRNFAGFPVNVSNILVTAGTNVSLVSSAEAADTADEIYLQMKPNSGTVLSLADYTASATETTSGSGNGTGKRPTAGAEWNIAAAVSGVGTSSAQASILNLNALSGKIGGFNQINPAEEAEIGQINWTIKAGTYTVYRPELTAAMISGADFTGIKAAANYITGTGKNDADYIAAVKTLVGTQMSVPLNNNGSMTVRLASVDNTRGLTFEAVNILVNKQMNSINTNTGGWAASDLQKSMNLDSFTNKSGNTVSDGVYATYFSDVAWVDLVREVSNSSCNYGGSTNTSTDKFWIASANNLFGAGWYSNNGDGDDGDAQFDFYVGKTSSSNKSDEDLVKKFGNSASIWWIRSAMLDDNTCFETVDDIGYCRYTYTTASSQMGIVPCFCF